jgi:hypothetical protein
VRHIRFTVVSFAVSVLAANALAAGPSIGVASARGAFRIDQAPVAGNATLFAGSSIETAAATSELQLSQGARMLLGQRSRGRVFADRFVLEQGQGQISAGYPIEARSLRVEGAGSVSQVLVTLNGANGIRVASLAGAARVTDARGLLLASVVPGNALEFEPQAAGAAPPARLTGTISKAGNRYLLTDETTHVKVELRGPGLERLVGQRVQVVGTVDTSVASASVSQVINVTSATAIPKSAAAAGAGSGISASAKAAIIAGVAVSAAGTGAALGLTRGEDTPAQSFSR